MKDNISDNLEKFILDFNSFEKEINYFIFVLIQKDLNNWDIVRYDVQFALCEYNGIYSYPLKTYEDLILKIFRLTRKFLI